MKEIKVTFEGDNLGPIIRDAVALGIKEAFDNIENKTKNELSEEGLFKSMQRAFEQIGWSKKF